MPADCYHLTHIAVSIGTGTGEREQSLNGGDGFPQQIYRQVISSPNRKTPCVITVECFLNIAIVNGFNATYICVIIRSAAQEHGTKNSVCSGSMKDYFNASG